MTAIAAFQTQGKAALIADMLLSIDDGEERWHPLPTNPEVSATLGARTLMSFGGLARKALIVNPRFAIAWAGNKHWAESLFRKLSFQFKTEHPSQSDLLESLNSVGVSSSRAQRTVIIGWVLGHGRFCFRWDSIQPDRLDIEEQHFDGTGAAFIKSAADRSRSLEGFDPKESDLAGMHVAATVAKVVCYELEFGDSLEDLFGFAYDMIVEVDEEFRYPPSVLFSHWDVECNPDSEALTISCPTRLLKWANHRQLAAVQIIQMNRPRSTISSPSDVAVEQEHDVLVLPVTGEFSADDVPQGDWNPLNARWLAACIDVHYGPHSHRVVHVDTADNTKGPFAVLPHGASFRFDVRNAALKQLFRPYLAKALRIPLKTDRDRWELVIEYQWPPAFVKRLRCFWHRLRSRWTSPTGAASE